MNRSADPFRIRVLILSPLVMVTAGLVGVGIAALGGWLGGQGKAAPIVVAGAAGSVVVVVAAAATALFAGPVMRRLLRSEQWFRQIAETSFDTIFVADTEGRLTYVSPAAYELTGYRVDEVLGTNYLHYICPADAARAQASFLHVLAGGREQGGVYEMLKRDGEIAVVEINSTPVITGQNVSGVQGIIRDITKRRQIEEALCQREQHYRLLAENVNDVIWTSDLALHWTYVSPSFQRLTGYTPEETMAMTVAEMVTPETAERAMRMLAEAVAAMAQPEPAVADRSAIMEAEFRRKDGTTVWTEVHATFVKNGDGEPAGIIGVTRDVSRRKAMEDALRQKTVEAEAANRSKSEFLANMSHELRTPLTAILGFAELLRERLSDRDNIDAAETILRNGRYLLGLLSDILDLSKIEAGKLEPEQLACSPVKIVGEVAELMRGSAAAKGLSLDVVSHGDLPRVVQTDPLRLRQILINLVGNAIKFTETGRVQIAVALAGREQWQIQVTDSGIGMDEGQLERLFQVFTQADASTSRRFGGTGLGLAISKRLAELLGGDIKATSQPGRGSVFTLRLPVVVAGPPAAAPPSSGDTNYPVPAANGNDGHSTDTAAPELPLDVLLVEDGVDNQRLIALLLEKWGARVEIAENGQLACEKVLTAEKGEPAPAFDLILMDMQMPVMDGYEATRRLRAAGYRGPIVALTAHAMADDRRRCLEAGCDDYLSKPVDRRTLSAMLNSCRAARA